MAVADREVVAALLAGDEHAFRALVQDLSPVLLRLARNYTPSAAAAQDAVQDTWLAVIEGLARFEGRASLRTWICSILINQARKTGVRESRLLPLDLHGREPAVDPARFARRRDAPPTGTWLVPPVRWDQEPETHLSNAELKGVIDDAIGQLPVRQREIITVRDVLGMDADEAAALLGVSAGNQRVLLHRARSKVRASIESYAESRPSGPHGHHEERSRA